MSLSSILAHPVVSATGHAISLATIVGAFAGLVPTVAAVLAAIWYVIEILESKSGQVFLAKFRKPAAAPAQEAKPDDQSKPPVA